jgi:energy-converting hydrogenase Eha subunit E
MIIPSRLSFSSLGAGTVALLYTGIAALWIIGSGALLGYSIQDPVLQLRLELAKGLGFVAVTGSLLYLLLTRLTVAPAPASKTLPHVQRDHAGPAPLSRYLLRRERPIQS